MSYARHSTRKPMKFGYQEEQLLGFLDTKFQWLHLQIAK